MTFIAKGLAVLAAGAALVPASVTAQEAGDLLVRARGILVMPDESSTVGVIGGEADAETVVVPELDFTYFVTDNIAAELILATSPHDVEVRNSALGTVSLGSVWLLPPTLTLQYHFSLGGGLKPYVGAGINYTIFYGEDAPGGTVTSVDYDNSIGPAFQAGVDYAISDRWLVNFDVKKVFINTDVSVNNGAIPADVDLDPWIIGIGIGYRY